MAASASTRTRPGARGDRLPVFERDRALLDGLDAAACAGARALGMTPVLKLARGTWTPPSAQASATTFGHLVLDGLLVRRLEVAGRMASELIGQGDVLQPWPAPEHDGAGDAPDPPWRVVHPATVAVLDEDFGHVLSRWPRIARNLLARAEQRSRGLLIRTAIPQIRQADERLRLLFWELADRWGRVTPAGVVLPLALTNGVISQLAAMHRPTVSRTLALLAERGEIVRHPDGGFILDLALGPAVDAG